MADYDYDVALSFAGEDRQYVEKVAETLQANGVSVFYDDSEKVDLWGKDLAEHLDAVYRQKAKHCIVFISSAYAEKAWPTHERKSALARAVEQRGEYILPARFDDTEVPGIRPTMGYIDLRRLSPSEFAAMVMSKLGKATDGTAAKERPAFRVPTTRGTDFNPYAAALTMMDQVVNEITSRCHTTTLRGVSASSFGQDRERCVRIVAQGQTVSLDMTMDETFGHASITFHGTHGVAVPGGTAFNAWGTMEEDPASGSAVLRLNDMGLLDTLGAEATVTTQQFVDALWDKICDAIEDAAGGA